MEHLKTLGVLETSKLLLIMMKQLKLYKKHSFLKTSELLQMDGDFLLVIPIVLSLNALVHNCLVVSTSLDQILLLLSLFKIFLSIMD